MVDDFLRDVRDAVRSLRRSRAFTAAAVLTLALGIAINAGAFTFVNAMFLRQWPVDDPQSIVWISARSGTGQPVDVPRSEYEVIRGRAKSFAALSAANWGGSRIGRISGQMDEYLQTGWVSGNFFTMARARPLIGRMFVDADDAPGAPAVAVISERWWRGRFGGDPGIIGRTMFVGAPVPDVPVTIVGVLPHRYATISINSTVRDLWLPLRLRDRAESPIVGRLAAGVSIAAARAELDVITASTHADAGRSSGGVVMRDTAPGLPARQATAIFAAFAGLFAILALVCTNLGMLQLARGARRDRDAAVRLALGASRARLVRQIAVENLLLCAAAAVIGLTAVRFGLPVLERFIEPDANLSLWVPDLRVALFVVVLCLGSTLVVAFAPARRALRGSLFAGASVSSFTTERHASRGLLLGAQVALCTVLVMAAMLLSRAVEHALTIDPGFALAETMTATIQRPPDYDSARAQQLRRTVLDALRDSPLWPVGLSDMPVLNSANLIMAARRPTDPVREARVYALHPLSPEAFQVLRIPVIAGRLPSAEPAALEIVVNRAFARQFGGDPIGQTLIDRNREYRIVGIVGDARLRQLDELVPMIHTTTRVADLPNLLFSSRVPDGAARLREIVQRLEPAATVTVQPLTESAQASLRRSRNGARVAWGISALGLLIAAIGLCGVFGAVVEERRREIGVRIALGARAQQIALTVMGATSAATLGGLIVGLLLSIGAGQALRGLLYGMSPLDPWSYLAVVGVLVLSGVAAGFVPMRRAARVDPVLALRAE